MKNLITSSLITGVILQSCLLSGQTKMIRHKLNELGHESDITFFTPDNLGGWFIIYDGGNKAWWSTIPENQKVVDAIQDIFRRNYKIKSIAFTPDGLGYVITVENNGFWYDNIPSSLIKKIKELNELNKEVDFIQFSNNNGWVVVYDDGYSYEYQNFPKTVGKAIKSAYDNKLKIKSISFTPTGGWALLYGDYQYSQQNINLTTLNTLSNLYKNKETMRQICFTEFNETFINTDHSFYHDFMNNHEIDEYINSIDGNSSNWFKVDANNIYSQGRKLTPKFNLHKDNVLTIEKAHVRDNGEHSIRGAAAIGIYIFYSYDEKNWVKYGWAGELIGRHYEGNEKDGKAMLEWHDNEKIEYLNYGILDWDTFPNDAKYLRILLLEGDHESEWWAKIIVPFTGSAFKDDVVFDYYTSVSDLKTGRLIKLTGSDASLWLRSRRIN